MGIEPALSQRVLARRTDDKVIAGVASGVADWLRVDALFVRIGFVVLAVAAGWGFLLYLAGWWLLPDIDRVGDRGGITGLRPSAVIPDGRRMQSAGALGLIVLGSLLLLREVGVFFPDEVVWPCALAAVGVGVLWADPSGRAKVNRVFGERALVIRFVAGVALVASGIGVFLAANSAVEAFGQALIAALATAAGLGLLLGPWAWRMARDLAEERRERIRSEERAEMATHLHDSVLQTLALIQRSADRPRQTVALARRQERELRAWLYAEEQAAGAASAVAAIRAVAERVEEVHQIPVEVVAVGTDRPHDDDVAALAAATREAIVNAAKHSGAPQVSVFVEIDGGTVEVFVRDRGAGFDPRTVGEDRRGIQDSIRGRLERHGGTATITSAPGEGTEVALAIPAAQSA